MQKNCQHAKYLIFIVKSLTNARIGILQVYIINLHVHINKSHVNINKTLVISRHYYVLLGSCNFDVRYGR